MLSIASLKIGQRAVIKDFSVDVVPLKLLEMGCLPGNEVALLQEAERELGHIPKLKTTKRYRREKAKVKARIAK